MVIAKLLTGALRSRRRTSIYLISSLSSSISSPYSHLDCGVKTSSAHLSSSLFASHFYVRSVSTRSAASGDSKSLNLDFDPSAQSGFSNLELNDDGDGDQSGIVETLVSAAAAAADGEVEERILPIRVLVSVLDSYHDVTGFPWWIVIASSTLALRIALLPMLMLQFSKIKKISEFFPKLPPPIPPPLSGRSYINQLLFFRRERRAIGCPSYLWSLAYVCVQVPCFLLWMTTIRRMSLEAHPGFDHGGAFWFENLTQVPHGVLGIIFPFLIGGLHFLNVQISFQGSSVGKVTGQFSSLAKLYRQYLNFLTVPLLFTGFMLPQGSLVYWVTNSSLSLIQQLILKHPSVREKLGLPNKDAVVTARNSREQDATSLVTVTGTGQRKISVMDLSPPELLALSVKRLTEGQKDKAISLLRLALDKDPEYVGPMILMGQALLQSEKPAEAVEYFERAISKLFLLGQPTETEEIDHLILASIWAGAAYIRQGKENEGLRHLERLAHLKEPEDPKSKAHYYDGIVMLASALYRVGRKAEAAKYLRHAVAYDSAYSDLLAQCENEKDDFSSDLVNSRRGDY
ncbi:ALBINO3-like protein 2, chloroplastic [Impatiens glandulifera]|uniref:ALBINO3-like protein 2, chloroplastic n=1 Tax=Impatiens glandulifera TaxID=253017 RepID=UPI001FB1302F|nr:ALBINO3-like protein 2, chloroplastic [Impatiens glandulifera]